MSPSEKEDDTKKTGVRPEPLCLFCFPEDVSLSGGKTYVNSIAREPYGRRTTEKEEVWSRKRAEERIKRRKVKEPIRNLKSYLLTSVRNEKLTPNARLPSLFEVLETVKDAWPSPSSKKDKLRHENTTKPPPELQIKPDSTPQQFIRPLSMPEELIRKYSVTKDRTSEESETKTAIDISPSSSSTLETTRRKPTARPTDPPTRTDASQQTTSQPKRVTQNDYYQQGRRIIHQIYKEETDTESPPSSSPTQLPKQDSSSGNISSESDNLQCTCTELSSKTTTDFYLSGKSTLSQTVSDKSMSTQDSTVSINSISTSDISTTSAKETSPDNSPRKNVATNTDYQWTEELYAHRKFIHPVPSITTISGPTYKETEYLNEPIMIPRYSALPRSLSMLVNTSSPDSSHHSDSDSLPDSLEDQPITVHRLYDTKQESKPVRGDVTLLEPKPQKREPRGRAYFVSLKQPFGEDEMLENIEKIPQPPEKIKNQIFERHLNLCAKHKNLHEPNKKEPKPRSKPKPKPKPKQVETTQIVEIPPELKPHSAPSLRIPPLPVRKSPIGRFRQRFEVIPEEKSSSLSSAEDKTLPKFTDACTSPLPSDIPNLIVAKLGQSLPRVKGSDRKIIIFSKQQNSTKGRDALIAMNREDFNRLAKGWMNFYKLSENSENEEKPELGEDIRFDSSNTILKPSLPELKKGAKTESQDVDDEDSDSTDYMEPPSPRVPPLPIDDIPSDSSSDTEIPSKPRPTGQTLKYLQFKKRESKARAKKETSVKKKNSGWSVTVEGTVELSRSAPDLEMRLSFPASGGAPIVSHSDSGFAEDSNYSKLSESLQDLDSSTERKEIPLASGDSARQKWMVTVKNPIKGEMTSRTRNLPSLEPAEGRNSRAKGTKGAKGTKEFRLESNMKRLVERKMRAIWPEVQQVIRREFLTETGRLITEVEDVEDSCLSVRGNAVSMERKQKPPTMTERDVTRRFTSRTG